MADEQRDIKHKIYATQAALLAAIQAERLYYALDTNFFYFHDGTTVQSFPASLVLADQTGVYGASILGAKGITNIVPTGGAAGDPGTTQAMMEGLAVGRSGLFPATLTGVTTTVTGTAFWSLIGKQVCLRLPALTGISNTIACGISGLPNYLWPARSQTPSIIGIEDNGTSYNIGKLDIETDGSITLLFATGATGHTSGIFTNSGTKGLQDGAGQPVTYMIN